MADDGELKIKGTAEAKQSKEAAEPKEQEEGEHTTQPEQVNEQPRTADAFTVDELDTKDKNVESSKVVNSKFHSTPCTKQQASEAAGQQQTGEQVLEYKWCKIFYEATPGAQNCYYMHFDTRETQYEEPTEPYWIWDALTNNVHACGLQQPSTTATAATATMPAAATGPSEEYQGYNPKIHGSYDPNAPYAKFHNQKHAEEKVSKEYTTAANAAGEPGDFQVTGTFNRFTGAFQSEDKGPERHNDYNKSGRQMNAFFDVDAAANTHGGKSLKEERRNQKLSKKEIQELNKTRREKKEKKRMDFYRS